jgi:phosphoribosylaminoimidazole carboxylase
MEFKKVGILGGGQLGRMMVEASHRLGLQVTILDQPDDCPAKQLSSVVPHVDGAFKDSVKIKELKKSVDVVTVEIEHIDVSALKEIEAETPGSVQPTPFTLETIQDKYLQKVHLQKSNIPLPDFKEVKSTSEVQQIAETWGYPIMVKSKKLAYDGRGNFPIKSQSELSSLDALFQQNPEGFYVEKWVPYVKELAIMVVRNTLGEVVSYPVVETIQKDNICHLVIAPAVISGHIADEAKKVCENAIKSFDGAGIFGVEMFLLESGKILLNEIAPRPHNSGHYTIEACETSQFENHLRAVAGLPLGSGNLKVNCSAMVNLLGDSEDMATMQNIVSESLKVPGTTNHWYGKAQSRKGRKMGHITVVAQDFIQLRDRLARVLASFPDTDNYTPTMELPAEVGIIMGSDSDLPVMKAAAEILDEFEVPHEVTIVSAHRTPDRMVEYARQAHLRGMKVIIAGAGGAAHLPGMVASMTPLPVIGVPVCGKHLDGVDSLHSIVQMPRGVPVATVAINNATNAGLLAVRTLGCSNPAYLERMNKYQEGMKDQVLKKADRLEQVGYKNY